MGFWEDLFGTGTSKTNTPGGSRDGIQTNIGGGETLTVNSAGDPKAEGGYYLTLANNQGDKATAVYNSDNTLADVKANNQWTDVPTQPQK